MNESKADQKKYGILSFTTGSLFVLYGIALFIFSAPPFEIGFLLNNIMILLDISWLLVCGGLLTTIGLLALNSRQYSMQTILVTGTLMIYTTVLIICSIIFNAVATPHFQTYGRVISYSLQAITRLLNPTFSIDFFIPLLSLIIFITLTMRFKKYVNNLST